jgi:hypothetical protein
MVDHPSLPRVYGEKEIGQLLKRATEMQHDEPTAPSASGMTLAELQEVALEAGIDPEYLRRAATELEYGPADSGFWTKVLGTNSCWCAKPPCQGNSRTRTSSGSSPPFRWALASTASRACWAAR